MNAWVLIATSVLLLACDAQGASCDCQGTHCVCESTGETLSCGAMCGNVWASVECECGAAPADAGED